MAKLHAKNELHQMHGVQDAAALEALCDLQCSGQRASPRYLVKCRPTWGGDWVIIS